MSQIRIEVIQQVEQSDSHTLAFNQGYQLCSLNFALFKSTFKFIVMGSMSIKMELKTTAEQIITRREEKAMDEIVNSLHTEDANLANFVAGGLQYCIETKDMKKPKEPVKPIDKKKPLIYPIGDLKKSYERIKGLTPYQGNHPDHRFGPFEIVVEKKSDSENETNPPAQKPKSKFVQRLDEALKKAEEEKKKK